MNTLSEEQIVDTLRLVVNAETFTVLAPMFGRIAVSLLILSIIGPAQTTYRIVLWTIVAIQVLENAAIIIELYTQCGIHVVALWDISLADKGYCISTMPETVMAYLSSAFNSLSDLILTAIPAAVLLKLQMQKRIKMALIALFATSLLAFAVSIVKALANASLAGSDFTCEAPSAKSKRRSSNAYDQTLSPICRYTKITVESNVIILTGSAPTLRPLWQKPQAHHYVYEDYGRTPSAGVQRYGHHSVARTRDGDSKVVDIKREKALGDGTSEEYILEDRPPNAIVRMTHVNVTYDNPKLDDEVAEQHVQPRGW
ncbi:hypothetical protein LTR54_002163 [Friedmanniomyces endolithicus]|uniref:Rhodopsin domain-containing protein n=1 Tax=Friedmanniomyces endolithicus TaxID=329885 RepID=A0AAN6FY35_9PEZI|nr:hypothetical protein LTR82_002396 [Friedmanniomyces endolithicus]KAK1017505.1 hypothetical protein LTR54_002163 [Friedmanniomyces endolithicus]